MKQIRRDPPASRDRRPLPLFGGLGLGKLPRTLDDLIRTLQKARQRIQQGRTDDLSSSRSGGLTNVV